MITIGKDYTSSDYVGIADEKSRAVLICGKRGSGKSYTLGVIFEELQAQENSLLIVIDPMGIYHTMAEPNLSQERQLWDWGLSSRGLPITIHVPGDPTERYGGPDVITVMQERGVKFQPLRLNPSDLSPDSWCDLFDLSINDVMGIALYRAVQNLRRQRKHFFYIADIIEEIKRDTKVQERTAEALLNRLEMAQDWDIFSTNYREIWEIFDLHAVNVIDLSVVDPGRYGLRNLIVDVIARDIFNKRTVSRRKEELGLLSDLPKVWMAIDEAHQFAPAGKASLAKETLIRWVKEGRQPGLSLILATQQPAAIDAEVLSQCDVLLVHKLTNTEDTHAINRLSQDYMNSELRTMVQKLNRSGEAILVDDEAETLRTVQIRPRVSQHGGGEAKTK
jgi:DNA helicase HerA-like ATPase